MDLREPIVVLHRGERWIAIDKPAGLLVHRDERTRRDPAALQMVRDQLGLRVWPVHRLDRATSGVLLFALDPVSARHVCDELAARRVDKRYVAVVRGWVDPTGVIDHPLCEREGAAPAAAITEFARLATVELPHAVGRYATARYSLVDVRTRSGRMHQIRRHFAHLRHPIVGDVRYGDGRHNRLFREQLGVHRLLLHARRLAFTDVDATTVSIEAPMPVAFERLDAAGAAGYGGWS